MQYMNFFHFYNLNFVFSFLKSNCSQIITELLCGLRELFQNAKNNFFFVFLNMEIQGEPLSQEFLNLPEKSTWTSFNKPFKLLFFYTFILTWNAFLAVVELLVVFTLNFCHVFLFNLSHKNFWTFSGRALELLATKLSAFAFSFFFSYKMHTM